MGINPMTPTPPPGFTLDEPSAGSVPPPPAGFELDQPSSSGYWGDVGRNAIEGVKQWPAGAAGLASNALAVANATTPVGIGRSIYQAATGQPTEIGQATRAVPLFVKGAKDAAVDTARNLFHLGKAPAQVVLGTPLEQTDIAQDFRARPLSTAATIGSVAFPAAKLFRGGKAAAAVPGLEAAEGGRLTATKAATEAALEKAPALPTPNYLEVKGAQGLNSLAGIRGLTVEKLATGAQNPGAAGTNLARTLAEEGAIGKTAIETFDKASKIANQYGGKVAAARKAIADEAAQYGEVGNPELVDVGTALKPITEEAARMGQTATAAGKRLLRPFKQVADFLAKKAESQGGAISLDDIKGVMDEVGPMTHKGAPEVQQAMAGLYAKLADVQDGIVQTIAAQAKNPQLAADLLSANKGYSRYMRILPDIRRAAAMESVGQMNLGGLFKDLKGAILSSPAVSRATMKAGALLKKAAPVAEAPPVAAAPAVAPAAKQLTESMAREFLKKAKGDKNLARQMAAAEGWVF